MASVLSFILVCAAAAAPWNEVQMQGKTILLHPKCQPLPTTLMGPFVTLGDRSVLAVDGHQALVSLDEGKTWSSHPLFADPQKFECRGERTLLRTRDGTIILAFPNEKERAFHWDQSQGGPSDQCRLPVYVTRSTDEGKTWSPPKCIQQGWCGALRTMIQLRSGRVVLTSELAVRDPGRHVSFTYVSDDEGATWKRSNIIDLGDYGGYGDHGGGIEPTIAQLHDGRLWMLIRTYRGCFTEAFSDDGGLTWKDIHPSSIDASGSPGQLLRLQSGRLVLIWNRFIDKAKRTGRREQLSMAFSEDDGRTWTDPVVVAYDPVKQGDKESAHRLSYPHVYERVPGELWVTTMQGPLRIRILEDDFLPRRVSDQTYRARYQPKLAIQLDGRLDEPAWLQANVEKGFIFPWKKQAPPATEFRALCDDTHLYFSFHVTDDDIVVVDKFRDEEDAVFEDRVELYFCPDDQMKNYFNAEIDSLGRPFDYRGSYYRRLDSKWTLDGLQAKGTRWQHGYTVEGRIPLASLQALGFPRLQPGVRIRWGLFRAEFSHDHSGRPVVQRESIHNRGRTFDGPPPLQAWMSWVDPHTEEPDFHVPTSLGWLEIVE